MFTNFVLRIITERAAVMQKDVYICFIDYTKAFNKVKHKELFEDLSNLDLHGKDLRLPDKVILEPVSMY